MDHQINLTSGQVLRGAGRDQTTLVFPPLVDMIGPGPPGQGWDWGPGVVQGRGSEIGIEDITVEFAPHNFVHGDGQGYNGIELTFANNSWIENVRVINYDEGVAIWRSDHCTADGVDLIRNPSDSHIDVEMHIALYSLATNVTIAGPRTWHGLAGDWGAHWDVFSNVVVNSAQGIIMEPYHNGNNNQGPVCDHMLYSNVTDPINPTAYDQGFSNDGGFYWNVYEHGDDRLVPVDIYAAQWALRHGVPPVPTNLSAAAGDTQVTLSWTASFGATSYNIYRATNPGGEGNTPYVTGLTGVSYTDTGLTNNQTYYYQVTAVNSNGESGKSSEVSATPSSSSLPPGWLDADIGSPAQAGSASYAGGTWTVRGSGANGIWDPADQFNFASELLTGDGTIIAKITSFNSGETGIMFRDSTAGSAAYADMEYWTGNNHVIFQRRATNGGTTSVTASASSLPLPSASTPLWLKLVRAGSTFTGSYSSDGTTWTQLGTASVTMQNTARVGLAVTSDTSSLTTGTFSSLSVTDTSGNLALSGTAYRWYSMVSATDTTNQTAAPGLNDNDLTTDVRLGPTPNDIANAYEGAGVLWSSPQSLIRVTFTNGSRDPVGGDGVFDANFQLQSTTDGTTWTVVTGWSLSPAYAYDSASAAGVTYTFSGPAISALGVRVVGQVHTSQSAPSSWWDNATEIQAFAGGQAPNSPAGPSATTGNAQVSLSGTVTTPREGAVSQIGSSPNLNFLATALSGTRSGQDAPVVVGSADVSLRTIATWLRLPGPVGTPTLSDASTADRAADLVAASSERSGGAAPQDDDGGTLAQKHEGQDVGLLRLRGGNW
jgi:hypothetical protein